MPRSSAKQHRRCSASPRRGWLLFAESKTTTPRANTGLVFFASLFLGLLVGPWVGLFLKNNEHPSLPHIRGFPAASSACWGQGTKTMLEPLRVVGFAECETTNPPGTTEAHFRFDAALEGFSTQRPERRNISERNQSEAVPQKAGAWLRSETKHTLCARTMKPAPRRRVGVHFGRNAATLLRGRPLWNG